MAYISLYRKYRSQTFDEIVGQDAVTTTIKNAIKTKKLGHAYLFTGPRGTGKTSTARIFAKALNCAGNDLPNPCGKCDQCKKITSGQALNVIEIDAASNRGIDDMRELREKIRYKPVEGLYKVYIIDEVHMLTNEAFNALLKILEEPPQDTVLILATTEPQKVPATISSRCQRFDFGRISVDKISAHLKNIARSENIKIEDDAITLIARHSEGALRDAISLMDQLSSYCEGTIKAADVAEVLGTAEPDFLFEFALSLLYGNEKDVFALVERAVSQGVSIPQLTRGLIYHFRNMMIAKVGVEDVLELSKEQIGRIKADAGRFSLERIKNIINRLSLSETDMKWHHNVRLVLEVALIEICSVSVGKEDVVAEKAAFNKVVKEETAPAVIIKEENVPAVVQAKVPEKKAAGSEVTEKWPAVLDRMKTKNLFGFVSLCEAQPYGINSKGKLVLRFKKGYSFHKMRIEEQKNMAALEEAISEVTGSQMKVECQMHDGDEASVAVKKKEKVSTDDVVEIFDGRII